ncbi:hypothetical protein AN958_04030 [Leucoagaricus sp. SymC.cos]|nr:hypothetical protein AN958_04030 [Leucoagaricus sp. SymC.cos]
MTISNNAPTNVAGSQFLQNKTDRVIKPLRKHQGMMETRSLPAEAFRFSHQPLDPPSVTAPTMEAEEDWSIQSNCNSDQSTFRPVVFD